MCHATYVVPTLLKNHYLKDHNVVKNNDNIRKWNSKKVRNTNTGNLKIYRTQADLFIVLILFFVYLTSTKTIRNKQNERYNKQNEPEIHSHLQSTSPPKKTTLNNIENLLM